MEEASLNNLKTPHLKLMKQWFPMKQLTLNLHTISILTLLLTFYDYIIKLYCESDSCSESTIHTVPG